MAKTSAGLLLYKTTPQLKILLVHPGGPYWKNRDEGAWTIPKGLIKDNEAPRDAAVREFEEETGMRPQGDLIPLGDITQKGGKKVFCWATESDLPKDFNPQSNTFEMEWPPHSGQRKRFPEIDRAKFFTEEEVKSKINPAQAALIARLKKRLENQ